MKKTFIPSYSRFLFSVAGASLAAVALVWLLPPYAENPDPNHTHADFAVWVGGKQFDFAKQEFMSGLSDDETTHDEPGESHHQFYHLHDGNGHVIHLHKPGIPLGDFFASLGFSLASVKADEWCWYQLKEDRPFDGCQSNPMRLYVNGKLYKDTSPLGGNPLLYVFHDLDQLLLTDATDERVVTHQLKHLTWDACRYSKTCPWKGDPPTEGCIADPTVPCTL